MDPRRPWIRRNGDHSALGREIQDRALDDTGVVDVGERGDRQRRVEEQLVRVGAPQQLLLAPRRVVERDGILVVGKRAVLGDSRGGSQKLTKAEGAEATGCTDHPGLLKYLLKIDRLCFDGWPDRAVQIKGGQ